MSFLRNKNDIPNILNESPNILNQLKS